MSQNNNREETFTLNDRNIPRWEASPGSDEAPFILVIPGLDLQYENYHVRVEYKYSNTCKGTSSNKTIEGVIRTDYSERVEDIGIFAQ